MSRPTLPFFLLATSFAWGQAAPPTPPPAAPVVTVSGQIRARAELVPDWLFDGNPDGDFRLGHRARAGAKLVWGPVSAFVQFQDVRLWGSELDPKMGGPGTLSDFDAGGIDLHQGWGELKSAYGLSLRVGRQEVAWQNQRLIGAANWPQQGRSLDGVRVVLDRPKVGAELLFVRTQDRPTGPTDTATRAQDGWLLAGYGGPRFGEPLRLDGVVVVRGHPWAKELLATFGGYGSGMLGAFSYEIDGYGQAGTRGDQGVQAFLVGVRANATIAQAASVSIGGGVDIVSGDKDAADGIDRSFDTLFASNHLFYGHMDRYLNLPVDTRGQGLVDGFLKWKIQPHPALKLWAEGHVFLVSNLAEDVSPFHGGELDVEAEWRPWKPFALRLDVWAYFPGPFQAPGGKPELAMVLETDFQLE